MKVRRDANERAIVRELQRLKVVYFRVLKADPPGCPDLFVFFRGSYVALEVKTAEGELSAEQRELFLSGGSRVVRTAREALEAIGAIGAASTGRPK